MDNQHRKISGYRELSAEEIELMNRIKAKAAELLALQQEVEKNIGSQFAVLEANPGCDEERSRLYAAEPFKWAEQGKTQIQQGVMALVRAVAQPTDGS